jgi:transposase
VVVEHIPWSKGKRSVTCAMMGFLARWARRLSWRETAQVFQISWEAVYRSVEWFVEWGLDHCELHGVEAIGVDEIHWGRGLRADNFLTVIYQIDAGCRRLLSHSPPNADPLPGSSVWVMWKRSNTCIACPAWAAIT